MHAGAIARVRTRAMDMVTDANAIMALREIHTIRKVAEVLITLRVSLVERFRVSEIDF